MTLAGILALVTLALFYLALYGMRWMLRSGYAHLRAGRHDEAVASFERAAKWSRRPVYALIALAQAHAAAGRREAELAALDRALAADPTSMVAFDARVEAMRGRATLDEVVIWLHQRASDERLPKVARAFALGQRGIYLSDLPGRAAEALADLEAAERVTADPLLEMALGRVQLGLGKRAEAIRWYELAANGAEEVAAVALATLMHLPGDDDATRQARERAVAEAARMHGETPAGALVRAAARQILGLPDADRELAEAAKALTPEQRARLLGEKPDAT